VKLGCFKIETGENIVPEFIGLRSKMYCYPISKAYEGYARIEQKEKTELKKREKGVPGHITNQHQLDIWKQILNNETKSFASFNMIKSEKLNVYTINQTKVALSNFDDKRYILENGYDTLAHGHYKIII
jgi:hypothetical protein